MSEARPSLDTRRWGLGRLRRKGQRRRGRARPPVADSKTARRDRRARVRRKCFCCRYPCPRREQSKPNLPPRLLCHLDFAFLRRDNDGRWGKKRRAKDCSRVSLYGLPPTPCLPLAHWLTQTFSGLPPTPTPPTPSGPLVYRKHPSEMCGSFVCLLCVSWRTGVTSPPPERELGSQLPSLFFKSWKYTESASNLRKGPGQGLPACTHAVPVASLLRALTSSHHVTFQGSRRPAK